MSFRTLDANALRAFIANSSKQHLAKNITKSTQKAHALGSINFQFLFFLFFIFFLPLFIITLKKKNYFFIHFLIALPLSICNSFLFSLSLSLSCNDQHKFGFNIFIFSLVILSLEMTRSLDCKWQWLDL